MQPLSEQERQEKLPYPKWWPIVAGALVGLLLRLFYSGGPDGPYGAMMGSFIFIAPFAVSAITVYLAERLARREWGYYMVVGAGANALFVVGTVQSGVNFYTSTATVEDLNGIFERATLTGGTRAEPLRATSSAFSAASRRRASRTGMWLVSNVCESEEIVSTWPGSKRPSSSASRNCR